MHVTSCQLHVFLINRVYFSTAVGSMEPEARGKKCTAPEGLKHRSCNMNTEGHTLTF